jgi:hypothetical protein
LPRCTSPGLYFRSQPQLASACPTDEDRSRHVGVAALVNADDASVSQAKKCCNRFGVDQVVERDPLIFHSASIAVDLSQHKHL